MKKKYLSIMMACIMLLTSASAGAVFAEEADQKAGQMTEQTAAETIELTAGAASAEEALSETTEAVGDVMEANTSSEEESNSAIEGIGFDESEEDEEIIPDDLADVEAGLPDDSAIAMEAPSPSADGTEADVGDGMEGLPGFVDESGLIEGIQVMEEEPILANGGDGILLAAEDVPELKPGETASLEFSREKWTDELCFTAPEDGGYLVYVDNLVCSSKGVEIEVFDSEWSGGDPLVFTQDGAGKIMLGAGMKYWIDIYPNTETKDNKPVSFDLTIKKAEDIELRDGVPASIELGEELSKSISVCFFTSTKAEDYLLSVEDLDCGETSLDSLKMELYHTGMDFYRSESFSYEETRKIPLEADTRYCLLVWAEADEWIDPVSFRLGIGKIPELSDREMLAEVKKIVKTEEGVIYVREKDDIFSYTPQADGYYLLSLSDMEIDPDLWMDLAVRNERGTKYYDDIKTDQQYRVELSADTRYLFDFGIGGGSNLDSVSYSVNFHIKIEKAADIEYVEVKNLPESPWDITEAYEKLTTAEYIVHYTDGEKLPVESWESGGYYHSSFMPGIWLEGSTAVGDKFLLQLLGEYIPLISIEDNPVPIASYSITPVGSYQLVLYKGLNIEYKYDLIGAKTIEIEAKSYPDAAEELVLGATFQQESESIIYKYIPSVSGNYVMEGTGEMARVELYDKNFKKLASNALYGFQNPHVSSWLEAGELYYYEINSMISENKPTLHFYQGLVITGVTVISLPDKREYVIGSDEQLDTEGLQMQVLYSDGSRQVLSGDEDSTGHINTYSMLYESDQEGSPDYNKIVNERFIETAGIYWLGIRIYPEYGVYLDVPVARVTFINPGEHIHLWGDWQDGAAATTEADATQVRTCELCGDVETRDVEGTKLTLTPAPAPEPTPSPTPEPDASANVPSASEAVLELTAKSLKMQVGQVTGKFRVTEMAEGDSLVSVKSGSPKIVKVAKVKPNGMFKLKALGKTGKAKITVTLASGKEKTFKVKVQKGKVATSKIKGVPKKLTLKYHKKQKLAVSLTPVTSQDKLTFTSSDRSIVDVTSKGVLKPKRVGKAKITVQSGRKKVTCTVTVKK